MMPKGNIVGQRDDAPANDIEDGATGPARITPKRALHVNLRAEDGSEIVSLGPDPVGLKNSGGTTINPATEDTLLTIDADTGAIKTAVEIIDNAISGNEMQVDVVGSLPTGTNTIGKVYITDGADDASVQVPGEWGTPILSGTKALCVNTLFHFWNPAVGTYPGIAGDDNWYAGLMSNEGEFITALGAWFDGTARRDIALNSGNLTAGTLRVALASNDVNASAIKTAVELIDNCIGTEDAAETAGGGLAMCGTVRRDVPASSAGTTGDNATLNTDDSGHLYATDRRVFTHASNQETSTGLKDITASAPGANTKYVIKSISIINNDTLDGYVDLRTEDSTGDVVEKIYLPAYGGQWNFTWPGEGRRLATANKKFQMNITTCDDVTWMVSYTTVAV